MRNFIEQTLMTAKAATGIGKAINVLDYQHIMMSVSSASSGSLTVKFAGAIADGATAGSAPDFTAAETVANMFDYIQVINLQTGTGLAGDTGLVFSGTDLFEQYEINVNGLKWFAPVITAYSAGALTVKVLCFDNQ